MPLKLIKRLYETFASFPKPEHSTNYVHCEECAEYDELLANVQRQSLTIEQIGTVAWGPIAFLTPDAMAYYFPRLAELALLKVENKDREPFLLHFILSLSDGPTDHQFVLFEKQHRHLVAETLQFIHEKYGDLVIYHCSDDTLEKAIREWSKT